MKHECGWPILKFKVFTAYYVSMVLSLLFIFVVMYRIPDGKTSNVLSMKLYLVVCQKMFSKALDLKLQLVDY